MDYLRIALLPFAGAVATCIVHAVLTRVLKYLRIAPQLAALSTFAIVNAALIWVTFALLPWAGGSGLIYVLLVYNCLAFCYLLVLNVSETSLHVHIIMEILLAGEMPGAELSRRYNAKHMIDARIDRMIALGQLTEKNGRYVLRSRGLVMVGSIINGWRRVLSLPASPE